MVTNDKCKMFRRVEKVFRMQLLGCSKEGTICYTRVLAYDATQMEKGFIYLSIYLLYVLNSKRVYSANEILRLFSSVHTIPENTKLYLI